MKKLAMFFVYTFIFFISLEFFTPKVQLFYLLEQQIHKFDVVIDEKSVEDTGFSLKINSFDIYVKGIKSVNIEELKITPFLVYNYIGIKNIHLDDTMKSFLPLDIESVDIKYSIFNPLNILIHAKGDFGEASAKVNILDKKVSASLEPSGIMKKRFSQTLKMLKKSKEGGYTYEKSF